jgi:hypothetical protein
MCQLSLDDDEKRLIDRRINKPQVSLNPERSFARISREKEKANLISQTGLY